MMIWSDLYLMFVFVLVCSHVLIAVYGKVVLLSSQISTLPPLALYPEPCLHAFVLNSEHMEVLVTSESEYHSQSTSPQFNGWWERWVMSQTTRMQLRQDLHTYLYSMNSKVNLSGTINPFITINIKNRDLGQEVDLFSGGFISLTLE